MDLYLLFLLNKTLSNEGLDIFFAWISQSLLFSTPVLLVVLAFLSWRFGKDGLKFWLLAILVVILGDKLGGALKQLIGHPRPCAELGEFVRRVDTMFFVNCSDKLNGMPSNHALNYFLFVAFSGFVLRCRAWVIGFGLLAVLVAISRVYLGVHYPSQVLLGALIGMLLGIGAGVLSVQYFPFVRRLLKAGI